MAGYIEAVEKTIHELVEGTVSELIEEINAQRKQIEQEIMHREEVEVCCEEMQKTMKEYKKMVDYQDKVIEKLRSDIHILKMNGGNFI